MRKPGFSEIPPVSKVNPFPTSITGFSFLGPPKYSIIINFGGSFVPCATAAKEPMPILVNLSLSNTVTFILPFLPTSLAKFANLVGVVILPG